MVGLHFVQFLDNGRVIGRQLSELAQTLGRSFISVPLDEVAWGFREEEQSSRN